MVARTTARIYQIKGGRHIVYLKKCFVEDSQFPFRVGEELQLSIDAERGVVTIQRHNRGTKGVDNDR